jgi:hypothetical protein
MVDHGTGLPVLCSDSHLSIQKQIVTPFRLQCIYTLSYACRHVLYPQTPHSSLLTSLISHPTIKLLFFSQSITNLYLINLSASQHVVETREFALSESTVFVERGKPLHLGRTAVASAPSLIYLCQTRPKLPHSPHTLATPFSYRWDAAPAVTTPHRYPLSPKTHSPRHRCLGRLFVHPACNMIHPQAPGSQRVL